MAAKLHLLMNSELPSTGLEKGAVFYAMHMAPGIAEYKDPKRWVGKVLLQEDALRKMDPSASGCPMFALHVSKVDPTIVKQVSVGWVSESFFNPADGKHWIRFVVTDPLGLQAIESDWRISNAYQETEVATGGNYQGVDYDHEVMAADYAHFAFVPDPRYESIILTPEEFKDYNAGKEQELLQLANAADKEIPVGALEFWKKSKEQLKIDENTSVKLPKSGVEKTLLELVNEADSMAAVAGQPTMANGEHMVEFGGEKMSVNSMVERCNSMAARVNALEAAAKDPKKEPTAATAGDDAQNSDDSEEEKKKKELAASQNSKADPAADDAAKKALEATVAATAVANKAKLLELQNAAGAHDVKVLDSLAKGGSGTYTSPDSRVQRGKDLF